jgi:type II secretory pathway pseudopilin PulG
LSKTALGFTLIETILVIGILALASVAISKLQWSVFRTQENGRDQYTGIELLQACADRLLTVRRRIGYGSVTNTLCNGMGGVGGFGANPTITLTDDSNTAVSPCSSTSCTATITVTKSSGQPASLAALTVQLRAY